MTLTPIVHKEQGTSTREKLNKIIERFNEGRPITRTTWVDLAAVVGIAGDIGYVSGPDAGTHTDPITSEEVQNTGIYLWEADGAGSTQAKRLGALHSLAELEAAEAAASLSQDWAESPTAPGDPGTKSAKTWAEEAAGDAATATTQAGVATTQAGNAAASAGNAASSASDAKAARDQTAVLADAAGWASGTVLPTLPDAEYPAGAYFLLRLGPGTQLHEVNAGGTAWDFVQWVAGPKFETVQKLLDSTATSLGGTGQIVEAQGYRYEQAASGASDHQLATDGGVKLYARPGDGPFYARSMHNFDVNGIVDELANLQGAVNFAQANGKRHLILPAGTLLIDGTLVLGNTGSGYHALRLQGANGSFLGSTLLRHAPGQVLNPLINVVGTRMLLIEDIRLNGNNPAPASRNGENFRDSNFANWVTSGVSAGRYNPYAGIAFSALNGTDPGTGNNYTFGSYGQVGLASKFFFERGRIEGFVAGAVLAPNAGTPGIEDILFRDSAIIENTYGICTTGTQQRNVIVDNCNMQGSWALFDNVTFGSQQGQPIYVRNSNLGKSVNSNQSSVAVGGGTTRDCYYENVRGLGVIGESGNSARFVETFDGCNMSFIGHDDDGTETQKDIPLRNFKTLEIVNGAILCKNLLLAAPVQPIRLRNVSIRCETTAEQATWGFFAPPGSEWWLSMDGCEMRSYAGPTRYINDVEQVDTIAARALIGRNTREIIQYTDGRRYRIVKHPLVSRGPSISNITYDSKDEISFDYTTAVDRPIAVNDLVEWRVHVPGPNNSRALTAMLPALRITDITGSRVTCVVLADIDTTYSPTAIEAYVQNFVNATEATGDTTSGSADILNVTNISNFAVGDWIVFENATFPQQVRITGISGTTITCHRTLNVTATAEPIFNARLVLI